MDLALADEGAPLAVQPAEAARLSEMVRAGGGEAALAAARAPSPVPGQVIGTGAGLAVLGYPYP